MNTAQSHLIRSLESGEYAGVLYYGGRLGLPLAHLDCLVWRWGLRLEPWRMLRGVNVLRCHDSRYKHMTTFEAFPAWLRPEGYGRSSRVWAPR